jgi:Trypsin-co-occurring domain 1
LSLWQGSGIYFPSGFVPPDKEAWHFMPVKLTTVVLAGGQELAVEVDEPPAAGVRAVALTDKGEIDFAAALEHIKAAASQLQTALASVAIPPQNCEISFGIKFSASAGVILAKAGTEANFGIKMSWSNKKE